MTRARLGSGSKGPGRVPPIYYEYIALDGTVVLPQRSTLNFTGGLVTVYDDPVTGMTVVDFGATGDVTRSPTGWPNLWPTPPNATLAVVDGTRTVSVTAGAGGYSIYYHGDEIQKAAATVDSVVFGNVEGQWFFYFDGTGVLIATQDHDEWIGVLLGDGVPVATLYWDATNTAHIRWGEERHGFMPGPTHVYLHQSFGAQWIAGAAVGDITADASGALDAHAQLSLGGGTLYDEDVRLSFTDGVPQAIGVPAEIPIFYLLGATPVWRRRDANTIPVIYSGDGSGYVGANNRLPYNSETLGVWALTQVGSNNFVCVHYFLTTDIEEPYIGIQGQAEYGSIAGARAGAETELQTLRETLPLLGYEAAPLATVIFQTNSTYGNTPKARIRTVATGVDYIDWRETPPSGAPGSSADNNANLTSETGETATSGAVTATVVQILIPDGYFGALSVDLGGEHAGVPATCYVWQNIAAVSGEGGAATIRDESAPIWLDPAASGVVVALDTNGQYVRLRVTGVAAQDWNWVGRLGLLYRAR